MDWLFEGRLTVYLSLALVAAVLVAMWSRDRKRLWLGLIVGVVSLALLYLLLDRAVETDREQIARKLYEMASGVERRDPGRINPHLAATFRYGGRDREGFRRYVEEFLRERKADSLTVWDLVDGAKPGEVFLKAKPRGATVPEVAHLLVKTEWTKEAGGQWRLVTFSVRHPFIDKDTPLDITLPP